MKNMMKKLLAFTMLFALIVTLSSGGFSMLTGKVKAQAGTDTTAKSTQEFTDFNAKEITTAMSPGWNLGNQLESADDNGFPGETNWDNPVITEKLIKAVKAAGFKSIRIPVSYLNMIGKGPDYTINKEWLDRVQEVVDYVVKNDLYAVINIHGDGFQSVTGGWLFCNGEDQTAIKAKFQAVWQQIATRFKDYDEHLIYETMNEISDFSYGKPKPEFYKNINDYNQIALDTIRKAGGYNNMRWVLMPGWNTNIDDTAIEGCGLVIPKENYLSDKIKDKSRIMISVHYYSPWDFCGGPSGEITQWGENAKLVDKTSTHSTESYMAAQFKLLKDSFTSKGYPVVIGEYGAIDKSLDDPDNVYYRQYYNRKLNENSLKNGCISMYWDNGYNTKYGFAIFDRATGAVTQQGIIDAIMSVYNPVKEKGNSTGITLNKSKLSMKLGDKPITLKAKLTPADSTDTIHWSSSDETVVSVSDKGVVKAQQAGSAEITVTANGNQAKCTVTVKASENCRVMLYAIETFAWSTVQSDEAAMITKKGGTYSLSLSGSKDVLSNIGSLYLKDISVQSGVTKKSIISSANMKIDSIKFNGVNLKLSNKAVEAINNEAFDFAILNQWGSNDVITDGAKKNDKGSFMFTKGTYRDINTITITFTISDVVMNKK